MKEVICIARNTFAQVRDGKITPQAEIVIVLNEPTYREVNGQVINERVNETVRFVASPLALLDMAKQFSDIADDIKKEVAAALSSENERNVS